MLARREVNLAIDVLRPLDRFGYIGPDHREAASGHWRAGSSISASSTGWRSSLYVPR